MISVPYCAPNLVTDNTESKIPNLVWKLHFSNQTENSQNDWLDSNNRRRYAVPIISDSGSGIIKI